MDSYGILFLLHNGVFDRLFTLHKGKNFYVGSHRWFNIVDDDVCLCHFKEGILYINGQSWSLDDYVFYNIVVLPQFRYTHLLCSAGDVHIPVMLHDRFVFQHQWELVHASPQYIVTNSGQLAGWSCFCNTYVSDRTLISLQ